MDSKPDGYVTLGKSLYLSESSHLENGFRWLQRSILETLSVWLTEALSEHNLPWAGASFRQAAPAAVPGWTGLALAAPLHGAEGTKKALLHRKPETRAKGRCEGRWWACRKQP
jgi:hypothetical protein